MIEFACDGQAPRLPSIKVVGVGGAGGNILDSLVKSGCHDVVCIAANTDAQALEQSCVPTKIQLGLATTKGLGTGANPELGRHAAEEDLTKIVSSLGDVDIVFLAAGMGGGTGSGALPVIAKALKDGGALTIAIVTTPFIFEGSRRSAIAREALAQLEHNVDALIVIPNQRLLDIVDPEMSLLDAFALVNNVLSESVKSLADIITKPGYINVDFADLKAVMKDMGRAVMGTGRARGSSRARDAADSAINSPLLENVTISGASGVVLNISGSSSLKLHEVSQAASVIYEQAAPDAHVILGTVINEDLDDEVVVTVVATGFERNARERSQEPDAPRTTPASVESSVPGHDIEAVHACRTRHREPSFAEADMMSDACVGRGTGDDLDVPAFMRGHASEGQKS